MLFRSGMSGDCKGASDDELPAQESGGASGDTKGEWRPRASYGGLEPLRTPGPRQPAGRPAGGLGVGGAGGGDEEGTMLLLTAACDGQYTVCVPPTLETSRRDEPFLRVMAVMPCVPAEQVVRVVNALAAQLRAAPTIVEEHAVAVPIRSRYDRLMITSVCRVHFEGTYAADIAHLMQERVRLVALVSAEYRPLWSAMYALVAQARSPSARAYSQALAALLNREPKPDMVAHDGRGERGDHGGRRDDDGDGRDQFHKKRIKWADDPTADVAEHMPRFEEGTIQTFCRKVMTFMYTRNQSRTPLLLQEADPLQVFSSAAISRIMQDDSYCEHLFSTRRAGDDVDAMIELIEQQAPLPSSLRPEDHVDSDVEKLARGALGRVLGAIRAVYHDTNLAGVITREARGLVTRCSQPPADADMTERLLFWDGEWHAAVQMWGPLLIDQAQENLNDLLPVVTGLMSALVQTKALEYANSFVADFLFADTHAVQPAVRELRVQAASLLTPFERTRPSRPDTADAPLAGMLLSGTQWRIGVPDEIGRAHV